LTTQTEASVAPDDLAALDSAKAMIDLAVATARAECIPIQPLAAALMTAFVRTTAADDGLDETIRFARHILDLIETGALKLAPLRN
jgi:hypothetical protein